MMNKMVIGLALMAITSCKETPQKTNPDTLKKEKTAVVETTNHPPELTKILEVHGGLANWKTQKTLAFTLPKPDGDETHTIDLNTRKEKIETPNYSMGYDNKDFWLEDQKEVYKGDPIFYHNLMFYFYAMPFVLADNGINYDKTENLEYEGKSYPGIRISYNDGVGLSSKDEYFLHYDAETNQMAWLGYTVTYRSGEKSKKIGWIRYNDWQELDGLFLPKSLTWHKVEEGKLKEAAKTRDFENVTITTEAKPAEFYSTPANAKVIVKE